MFRNLIIVAGAVFFSTLLYSCSSDMDRKKSTWENKDILTIGTYTREEGHVHGKADGIYVYEFDASTGNLSYITTSDPIVNPSYVSIHQNNKWIYGVSETGGDEPGAVYAYKFSEDGKSIEFINMVESGGDYPCFVSVHPSGKFVLVANYGGSIAVLPIDSDGSLLPASSVIEHEGSGPTDRQQSAHAHMIKTFINGLIYVADLGSDTIFVYDFDEYIGELIPTDLHKATESGGGPRHFSFHPDKPYLYVLHELTGDIEIFEINVVDGSLHSKNIISAVTEDVTQPSSADIHIHPNGNFLYSSHRGDANSITVFEIDQETGELTFIGEQTTAGVAPRNFVIHPSGEFLLVANQDSDSVVTFRINEITGLLSDPVSVSEISTPVSLKFLN